jgi:hypothetical protein
MSQRWLASVLLHCEKGFKHVEGYKEIAQVIAEIELLHEDQAALKAAA